MQSLLWMVLKSWWGLGVEKLFSSKTKTFKESSANLYISDLKTFRKAIEGLYWKIYLVGRKGIRVFCLKLLETFWSVIHMSEHSRITVDVLNALNDQTGQGHSQHSELITSPHRGYSLPLKRFLKIVFLWFGKWELGENILAVFLIFLEVYIFSLLRKSKIFE